jgi:hypothetical protein
VGLACTVQEAGCGVRGCESGGGQGWEVREGWGLELGREMSCMAA